MRFSAFSVLAVAALATVAVPAAARVNLVKNGNFEQSVFKENSQFGARFGGATSVTDWTSADKNGFNLWIDTATATTIGAHNSGGPAGNNTQQLANSFKAGTNGGHFVALDGDPKASGALTQMLKGLTVGKEYTVSFEWAGTQLQSRKGATTESLLVGFGDQSQSTAIVSNVSQGFKGWFNESFTFNAKSSNQLLSFLSIGTPSGLPPVALLDGVSVSDVPEPASWMMMIAGFGLVGLAARTRRTNVVAA